MAASAISTSSRTSPYGSYKDFLKVSMVPFERIPKEPGSKKLVHGEWVEVQPDDEDAIAA